ncbi:unnamed protein product [Calypogeia fissa]
MSISVSTLSFGIGSSTPTKLAAGMPTAIHSPSTSSSSRLRNLVSLPSSAQLRWPSPRRNIGSNADLAVRVKASSQQSVGDLRTCRNCKKPFDSSQNHPRACRFHTAHFGGETKRKFESVYTGGTMDTVGGGEITQYWHCCGSPDPFDPGCEAAPHSTYDD